MPTSFLRRLAFSVPFAVVSALPAFAADEAPAPAVIAVSAEGRASLAPDMAVLDFSVVKQAQTARVALDDNNKAMGAVIDALKKAGIADRDLQTSGFSVQPQYVYPQSKDGTQEPPELVGYQVSNSLSVRVRDLGKVGGILDQAVTLGINQGGQIQFVNENPGAALEEARRKAVANAMAKARVLADAANVKLGKPIQIEERDPNSMPVAPAPRFRADALQKAEATVPVENGENTYSVNVNMTFAILD